MKTPWALAIVSGLCLTTLHDAQSAQDANLGGLHLAQEEPDTTPPEPLWAVWSVEGGFLQVTFNEPLDPARLSTFNVFLSLNCDLDPGFVVDSALRNGTNWVLYPYNPLHLDAVNVYMYEGSVTDLAGNELNHDVLMQVWPEFTLEFWDTSWRYDDSGIDWAQTDPPFYDTAFDDSQWLSGPALLGNTPVLDSSLTNIGIRTPVPSPNSPLPITTYYRLLFNNLFDSNVGEDVTIQDFPGFQLSWAVDDGFIAYLNGAEVFRWNVPLGPITASTPAENSHQAVFDGPFSLPRQHLQLGENVLAIEVHQADDGASNVVWGARLTEVTTHYVEECFVTILNQSPSEVTLAEFDTLTLFVEAAGVDLHYQWRRDGVPIPISNTPILTIPSAECTRAGVYEVTASNDFFLDQSQPINVQIVSDDTPLALVSAYGLLDPTRIFLNFNKRPDAMTAANTSRYAVKATDGGGALAILSATLINLSSRTDPWTVVLQTSPRARVPYHLTVNGVRDRSPCAETLLTTNVFLLREQVLVNAEQITWRYVATGAQPDGPWQEPDYDDSDWSVGPAAFYNRTPGDGSNDGTLPEPIHTRLPLTDASNGSRIITYYFRARVERTALSEPWDQGTFVRALVDDGAIVYWNGTPIDRPRMPPDEEVDYFTLAAASNGTDINYEFSIQVPEELITETNTIAVEVHQNSPASSDVAWAAQMLTLTSDLQPVFSNVYVNEQGHLILEHTFDVLGMDAYIQTTALLEGTNTLWTSLPGGPHSSPFDAGPADGLRFFRVVNVPGL